MAKRADKKPLSVNEDDNLVPANVTLEWNGFEKPKPTKTFKNQLPEGMRYWHVLIENIRKASNGPDKFNNVDYYEIHGKQVILYQYDYDFVKARVYEEISPIISKLFDSLEKGERIDLFRQQEVLQNFYRQYQRLINNY